MKLDNGLQSITSHRLVLYSLYCSGLHLLASGNTCMPLAHTLQICALIRLWSGVHLAH